MGSRRFRMTRITLTRLVDGPVLLGQHPIAVQLKLGLLYESIRMYDRAKLDKTRLRHT